MPPFLETDRLVLRAFTEADADHLYQLNGDRDVMWFLSGGEPTPREVVVNRIIPFFLSFYERNDGLGFWAAQTRSAGDFLGWFHLRPAEGGSVDLGYRLRIVAHTMAVNQPSRRVMEKCGLTFVRGYHSDDLPAIPGAEQGWVEYALTRAQWLIHCGGAHPS